MNLATPIGLMGLGILFVSFLLLAWINFRIRDRYLQQQKSWNWLGGPSLSDLEQKEKSHLKKALMFAAIGAALMLSAAVVDRLNK